jgi:hypothetical protein
MSELLDRTTLFIIVSAFITALLCILPESQSLLPFAIMARGLHIGNTLFHEMGHTIFAWFFGKPAVPMIFTFFGADQAGGMSMIFDRNWFVQIAAFAALGYGCYWIKKNFPPLFIPAIGFILFILTIAFTGYYGIVIAFMGPGGAALMGGFFLFRAWIYLDARNPFERWLNALFGFFLTLWNFYFSYNLAFDALMNAEYSSHVAFGVSHNDFKMIAMMMPGWTVKAVAIFAMGYCTLIIIGSFLCALWLQDEW